MTTQFVLGLSGAAGAGKDTVADYLVRRWGFEKRVAIAENLKNMCAHVFDLSEYQLYDKQGKSQLFDEPIIFSLAHFWHIVEWMRETGPGLQNLRFVPPQHRNFYGQRLYNTRDILQYVGTDLCQGLDKDYHINVARSKVGNARTVIVSDIRFHNEAEFVASYPDSLIVRVVRPNDKEIVINRQHVSETEMSSWNFGDVINNSFSDISGLYKEIDNFVIRNNIGDKLVIPNS